MKKKLFLVTLMVALFVCIFATSASAAIVKHETDPGLDCAESAVSILDYDAFNNSTASDKTSKVVLTDGTNYYVFPAYYVFTTSSNFQPDLTNINKAMKAADASITTDLFADKKTAYVRIELPTWISNIEQGTGKLESWTGIKEFRFGTTLTRMTAQNTFTGCSNLEYISDISHMTAIGRSSFSGCPKLNVDIVWPSAVTSIQDEMFQNSGIKSITLPEGLTSIGMWAFRNCDNLTEIICPNTLKSVGKHAFGSCNNLETLSLGAGFDSFARYNSDYETTYDDKNLKYVYLPESFLTAISGASNNDYKHIFNISSAKITFFFTGTEDQANQIKTIMASTNNNQNLGNAEIEKYNPNTDYTTYSKNVIVWGYNVCKAFYNNEHKLAENTTISVDSYIEGFDELCICQTCKDITKVNEEQYAPVFVLLGYSAKINGDNICVGYSLNNVSLAKYEELTGKTISFGVVATTVPNGANSDTLEPVNDDLTPMDDSTIFANVTSFYASFDFVIKGFSAEYYSTELVMCAFVSDGSKVDYICAQGEGTAQLEYASTITFDSVAV